jgi:hypothetical protein
MEKEQGDILDMFEVKNGPIFEKESITNLWHNKHQHHCPSN